MTNLCKQRWIYKKNLLNYFFSRGSSPELATSWWFAVQSCQSENCTGKKSGSALPAREANKEELRDCMYQEKLPDYLTERGRSNVLATRPAGYRSPCRALVSELGNHHHVLPQVHSVPWPSLAPWGPQHGELGICPKFLRGGHRCVCCDLPQVRYSGLIFISCLFSTWGYIVATVSTCSGMVAVYCILEKSEYKWALESTRLVCQVFLLNLLYSN